MRADHQFGPGFALRVLGAIGFPVGASLPWIKSGQANKSVFGLVRSARELGLSQAAADLGVANKNVVQALFVVVFLAPLFAGAIVLTQVAGLRRVSVSLSVAVALMALVSGIAGVVAGEGLIGAWVAAIAGVASVGGIAVELLARRRTRTTGSSNTG